MKNKVVHALLALAAVVLIGAGAVSCKNETSEETAKSSDKQLLTFGFTTSANSALTADVTGTIDQSAHTVAATVPYGTNVTALVAAFTCSEKASVTVGSKVQTSVTTPNNFTSAVIYTVTAEDGSAQEYTVTVYYVQSDAICETVQNATATNTDSYGTNGTYKYFGSWPQTIKASDVTVYKDAIKTMGANTYYLGSDGYWYVKVTVTLCDSNYTFTDGTTVTTGTECYFKVEPIKWRVLENGKLLAESILANVAYYPYDYFKRSIDSIKVYPNNYQYSRIRAYLNGLSYTEKLGDAAIQVENTEFSGKGFLQTAFTEAAQSYIKTTSVDNSAASTTDITGSDNNRGVNSYACNNTSDKIYLLSELEATNSAIYKFGADNTYDTLRLRTVSDYARATGAYMYTTAGVYQYRGWWWLRSPYYDYSGSTLIVDNFGQAISTVRHCVIHTKGGVVPALTLVQ